MEAVPTIPYDWIPDVAWRMRYDGRVHPRTFSPPSRAIVWPEAANCQVFAYLLLAYHGLAAPWERSSELWTDEVGSLVVERPAPLDLVLVHCRQEAYGAHVAVALGAGRVVHLARRPGHPEIRRLDDLQSDERYRVLIGIKRVTTQIPYRRCRDRDGD